MQAAHSSLWTKSQTAARLWLLALTIPQARLSQLLTRTLQTTHREHCSCSPRRSKSLPTRLPTRVAKLAAFHNSRINLFLFYNLDVMMVRPDKVLQRIKPKCWLNCLLWKLREASASATFETRKEHLAGASTSPVDRPKNSLSQIRLPFWCIRKLDGYG